MSTIKVKYMVAAEAGKEALWLTRLVGELDIQQGRVQLHCNSQSVIYLVKNQVYHLRTKHVDARFYKLDQRIGCYM
jgi:hypothetical protein